MGIGSKAAEFGLDEHQSRMSLMGSHADQSYKHDDNGSIADNQLNRGISPSISGSDGMMSFNPNKGIMKPADRGQRAS